MDADAMASPLGAWASIRGYFTPATLFVVLNLVIGTIALTSRSRDQRRRRELHHHHHDYAHLHDPQHGHHYPVPTIPEQQHEYGAHYYYQQQQEYATPPPPLARTSSMLDRIRSIGLYRFRSGDFPPEYGAGAVPTHHDAFAPVEEEPAAKEYSRSRSEPAPAREGRVSRAAPPRTVEKSGAEVVIRKKSQAARVPAATRVVQAVAEDDEAVLHARAEEFVVRSLRQQEPASPPRKVEHLPYMEGEAEYVPPPAPMRAPPPLSRTSSVLDRLRSIGLYNFLGTADQPAAAPAPDAFAAAPVPDKKQPPAPAHYDRSRSEPARQPASNKKEKNKPGAAEAKMAKSSSSTERKPAPSLVSQPSVNTRAEAFIDSFRKGQSLKPQPHPHHHEEDEDEHVAPPPPAPLARTSSVLDRLRSFSLYLRPGDPAVPEDPYKTPAAAADEKAAPQYARSRSEPARDQVGKKKKAQQGISKTSSETNIAEEESAAPAEECVDARADDFINKFRQQLQLQRLNSLLSYPKQQ